MITGWKEPVSASLASGEVSLKQRWEKPQAEPAIGHKQSLRALIPTFEDRPSRPDLPLLYRSHPDLNGALSNAGVTPLRDLPLTMYEHLLNISKLLGY